MKHTLLTIAIAVASTCATAQTRIIDYPVTGKRTTNTMEFYQAEVSDTAVILKGDMYHRPNNWVRIASSSVLQGRETGKTYRLVRATGITLDKEEYMPASWNRSFTLQFEPVDARDKVVDFGKLAQAQDGFRINGISLESRKSKKKIHCRIEGKVVDNPTYSRLVLLPEGTDSRIEEWISIPVRNGKFAYDLYTEKPIVYELYSWSDNMDGGWRSASFFAENGKVEFTLYSKDQSPEIQSNSPLTKELARFESEVEKQFFNPLQEEQAQLQREDKVLTPAAMVLEKQLEKAKDREEMMAIIEKKKLFSKEEAYTKEYQAFQKKSMEVFGKYQAYQKEYIQSKPTLVGLYLLMQQMIRARGAEDVANAADLYNASYAGKFADNPMVDYIKTKIASQGIKTGGMFTDFTAPDLEGVQHTLSTEIKGKVALIDLWASWCGPCRQISKSMIPIYEAYKDKGFTIVGVARERQATDMKLALEKDKYPWLNLLELNDGGKIWQKYGIGNAGGSTFLVDQEGKILLIHPTAEEVKACLEKMLE